MGSKLTRQIREGFDKFYVRAVVILQRSDLFFICEHKLENKIYTITLLLDVQNILTNSDVLQLDIRPRKALVCLLTFFSCLLLTKPMKLVIIQTFPH